MNQSVNRLLLWYPRDWRDRYGEEFTELLVAEFAEHPRSFARALDIAASGLRARLAAAGLNGHPLDRTAAARASLSVLAFCGAAFGMFGVAMWSQLAIGLQWHVQDDSGINIAMAMMSVGLLVFGVVAAATLCGLIRATTGAVARGAARRLAWPALTALTGLIILFVGGRHFANAWPGTGGHLLWPVGHVPAWAAAFGWATTMWITSYVAHPGLLATFSATQLAWMALSPVAIGLLVTGVTGLASRLSWQTPAVRSPDGRPKAALRHSAFAMRYATWLFKTAVVGMILFLTGTLRWMASAGAGSPRGYHVGAIDFGGLTVLALALAVTSHVIRTARLTGAVER